MPVKKLNFLLKHKLRDVFVGQRSQRPVSANWPRYTHYLKGINVVRKFPWTQLSRTSPLGMPWHHPVHHHLDRHKQLLPDTKLATNYCWSLAPQTSWVHHLGMSQHLIALPQQVKGKLGPTISDSCLHPTSAINTLSSFKVISIDH